MTRKILISIIMLLCLGGITYVSLGSFAHYMRSSMPNAVPIMPPPKSTNDSSPLPPPVAVTVTPSMKVSVAGMSIDISEQTPWESIFKLLFIILGTYVGIRLTNKYIRN